MLSIIRYSISLGLLVTVSSVCLGQEKEAPKKEAPKKVIKPKKSFIPTGIRVGTDLIDIGKNFQDPWKGSLITPPRLAQQMGGKAFQGWEVNGDIDFANYYVAVDIGSWSKDVNLVNGEYTNGGAYYRVGVDINLLGKDPDKNMFFFGFRYGRSVFHESVWYQDASMISSYGLTTNGASNSNVSGGWGELTSGLRVKVWKGLWMGYTGRMKFAPGTKGSNPTMAPYDMPGYGLVSNTPWWGFNYQVFWKFAWKKDKPTPKK